MINLHDSYKLGWYYNLVTKSATKWNCYNLSKPKWIYTTDIGVAIIVARPIFKPNGRAHSPTKLAKLNACETCNAEGKALSSD